MNLAASSLLRFVPPALSGSAHAALIAALIVVSPLPQQDSAGAGITVFEVSMVEEGEASASAGVALPESPPEAPQQQAAAEPDAAPAMTAPVPPPEMISRETSAPKPQAVARPKALPPPKVPPAPKSVAERPRPKAALREADSRRGMGQAEGRANEGRASARAGRGGGAAPGSGLSGAAYAGKVRAILQARANALGIEDQDGAVGLSFVIGASGRMESHAITRTSGSGSVDRLIRGMMAGASFPPPPGGRFSGAVTIRIQ